MPSGDIVIYGTGGHARKVYHTAVLGGWNVVAFVDDKEKEQNVFFEKKVFKTIEEAFVLTNNFFIAIGDSVIRRKLSDIIIQNRRQLVTICHPSAYICSDATLYKGIFVGANSVVESKAIISNGCIVDIGSLIDHNAFINEFVHVKPGTIVNSYSII